MHLIQDHVLQFLIIHRSKVDISLQRFPEDNAVNVNTKDLVNRETQTILIKVQFNKIKSHIGQVKNKHLLASSKDGCFFEDWLMN